MLRKRDARNCLILLTYTSSYSVIVYNTRDIVQRNSTLN